MEFLKVLAVLSLYSFMSAASKCNLPPKHWCDSEEIALECGVLSSCFEYWHDFQSADPVSVSLYYESLCPFCRDFISEQFYPTWKLLNSTGIMVVDMVPYGNAHEVELSSGQWNYTCQHGPKECEGNLIENCVMEAANYNVDIYFPIIFCIENATDPTKAAKSCVKSSDLNWKSIESCSKGDKGNALMHKAAMKTSALSPPHKYVPWIVANGVHTDAIQQSAQSDLLKFVCEMYKGTKPKECQATLIKACPRQLY